MLIKIQAAVLVGALAFASEHISAQAPVESAGSPRVCNHCDRATPFGETRGVKVVIMLRDAFAQPSIDAVIRDEPGATSPPVIALRRSAVTPSLIYRALSALSEDRTRHHGPPPKRATR